MLKKRAMDLKVVKKSEFKDKKPVLYPAQSSLVFFPLSKELKLCRDIDQNLFELEKTLDYFNFTIKEIKEIT